MPGFINTRARTHMHTFTPPHTRTHICTHSHTPPASTTTAHVPRVRRWLAIGIPAYMRSGWNQLDMVVVVLSIMSVVLENTQGVEGASPRFVQVRAPVCAPSRHAHPQVCARPCVRLWLRGRAQASLYLEAHFTNRKRGVKERVGGAALLCAQF